MLKLVTVFILIDIQGKVKSNDYRKEGCAKCSDLFFDCHDGPDDIICPLNSHSSPLPKETEASTRNEAPTTTTTKQGERKANFYERRNLKNLKIFPSSTQS